MSEIVKYNLYCDKVYTDTYCGGVFWAKFLELSNPIDDRFWMEAPIESPFDYTPDEQYEFEIQQSILNESVILLADARINDPYKSLMSIYGMQDGVKLRLNHEYAKKELNGKLKSRLEINGSQTPYYDIDELRQLYNV